MSDSNTESVEDKVTRVRPLNATETKNAQRLIGLRFEQITLQLAKQLEHVTRRKKEALYSEERRDRKKELQREVRVAAQAYNDALREIRRAADDEGLKVETKAINADEIRVSDNRLNDQGKKIQAEHDRDMALMRTAVQQQENEVQIQLLNAALTGDVGDIVTTLVPSTDQILENMFTSSGDEIVQVRRTYNGEISYMTRRKAMTLDESTYLLLE